jgi:hypothetical protein
LRASRTPLGKFKKGNGTLVKMDSRDYNLHTTSCILCLGPQYKSMLTATPLLNGIKDRRRILRFRESSSWLSLQLLEDTFDYTLTIDDD